MSISVFPCNVGFSLVREVRKLGVWEFGSLGFWGVWGIVGAKGERGRDGRRERTIIGVLAKCRSIASILFVNWSRISSCATGFTSSSSSGSDGAQILRPSVASERMGTGGEGRWLCGMNVVIVSSLRWGSIGV